MIHTLDELAYAREVIAEYLDIGAVSPCQASDLRFLVPWFVVTKLEPNGDVKRRLITNLRKINAFVTTCSFKLDHWGVVYPMLKRGMWCAKVDLSHAYFHVPLSKHFSQYVGVQLGSDFYKVNGLPFGLNALPEIFCSFMRVPLRLWRQQGLIVFVYMDDILILGESFDDCKNSVETVVNTLREAVFLLNESKSVFEPTQHVEFLGIDIDMTSFPFLPQAKKF